MECQYCKKTFNNKYTLGQHQKTAKYCLDLQGIENTSFSCAYCNKNLCTNDRLYTHYQSCKEKQKIEVVKDVETQNEYLKKTIQEKNDYITKLETKIEKMESKLEAKLEKLESTVTTIALESKTPAKAAPTTNNTTNLITVTNNNVLNLSQEHVKKVLAEKLDFNVVYAGQAGLAKFVVDYILTDEDGNIIYRCVDPSRQTFEFIDEKGEKVRDVKAEKLIQSLLKGDVIRLGLEEAAKGWNTDDNSLNLERTTVFGPKVSEYAELNRNNTVFRSKVSSLTA
jgi:uncharacterized coiled-coil protein SlyX